jgi:PAS domain S-box-containing protein
MTDQLTITILAVDDEPQLLEVTKSFLEDLGLVVQTSSSVEEARKAMRQRCFDAIVSDYQMPREDGISFLRSLRQNGDRIPFILMTGKGREEVAIEALNSGADFYLQKGGRPEPFYAELGHKVRAAVGKRRAEEALQHNEARYRAILNQAVEMMILHSQDGRILDVNRAACSSLGYSRSELLAMTIVDIDPGAAEDKMQGVWKEVCAGRTRTFEARHLRKNGSTYPIEVTLGCVELEGVVCVLGMARDITEKKKHLERQQENEEVLHAILDHVNVSLSFWSVDGRVILFNNKAASRMGLDASSLVGKDIMDLFGREAGAVYLERIRQAAGSSQPMEYEDHVPLPDGGGWFLSLHARVLDADGNVRGVLIFSHDISRRKETEENLRHANAMLQAALDQSPAGIAIAEAPSGDLRYVNRAGLEIGGGGERELVSGVGVERYVSAWHLIDVDGRPLDQDQLPLARAVLYGESNRREMIIRQRNGEDRSVVVSAGPVLGPRGVEAGIAIFTDITEIKKKENLLRSQERFLNKVLDTSPNLIYIYDLKENRNVYVNRELASFLGYSGEAVQAMGSRLFEVIIHPDDLRIVLQEHDRLRAAGDGEVVMVDFRLKSADGRWHWMRSRDVVFDRDADGSVRSELGFTEDITEMVLAQESSRASERKLQLLSSITWHDMNNKLLVLQGELRLMMLDSIGKEAERLKRCEKAAESIAAMVQFSREYQKIGAAEPIWISFGAEAARSLTSMDTAGLGFLDHLDGMEVLADPMARNVPHNLIENTLRYGEKATKAEMCCEERDGSLLITYVDNGVGIGEEERTKLFERGAGRHTGYGLFLCREILSITGISIIENGKPGEGVRFEILVPPRAWRRKLTA